MVADKIERGIIVFPKTGCELLIAQLTGFGVEKHDDLVDALTVAVIEIMNEERRGGTIRFGRNAVWDNWGPHGRLRGRHTYNPYDRRSRLVQRLDDFNEATSGMYDY